MAGLNHLEIAVQDVMLMERFWVENLGFWVTDRSDQAGEGEMVFMTSDDSEHHQVVLRQSSNASAPTEVIDHVAFQIETLADLRAMLATNRSLGPDRIETVSHGSTWSLYVHDPEGGRVEFFVDTPWPIRQPCRFEIDLDRSDLEELTRSQLESQGLL
ncbi:MAG: VOC family protein [Actinomycetota bacterium]